MSVCFDSDLFYSHSANTYRRLPLDFIMSFIALQNIITNNFCLVKLRHFFISSYYLLVCTAKYFMKDNYVYLLMPTVTKSSAYRVTRYV